jgi:uncharacterized protein YcbK (DUF882 family)
LGRGYHLKEGIGRTVFGRLKTRLWSRLSVALASLFFCTIAFGETSALPQVLSLKVYHIHTGEKATIVFKRNGVYDKAGLAKLNEFVRDWRKDQPTNMDPKLFDLLWQVYRQSGSHDYIHIVCGYRSPDTNGMLRRRSRGVAKNSLHMQGKAMDFFIPDVALPKLRAIGLKMQLGGVGFYPTSGSPFVHMDTGSVRMWPRMTRQQLVGVFPNGRTLYVPSDGKPLPGYAQALAEYKARKAGGGAVATFAVAEADAPAANDQPVQLASVDQDEVDDNVSQDAVTSAASIAPIPHKSSVAIAELASAPMPLPRLAPRHTIIAEAAAPVDAPLQVVAYAELPKALPKPRFASASAFAVVASVEPLQNSPIAQDFDFGSPGDWSAPAVPAALAKAMAERDQLRRGSSLPIEPTSIVATIDVSRPLRAEAITTAVLRRSTEPVPMVPHVMAYAAEEPLPLTRARTARVMTSTGVPLPQLRPNRNAGVQPLVATRVVKPRVRMEAPVLTLTSLDTQGLRMWIGSQSTRQKSYALLTMPDFAAMPGIMDKPSLTFSAGFGASPYPDLRTDRFSGALVQQPGMVDLTLEPLIASIR